ncbi:MAG: hypothetical protein ACD_46C00619G0002 [uncultured bacterium]|nr:MAG: hypothetical protein ACD_46C00619G0002 [uncultured bacterium]
MLKQTIALIALSIAVILSMSYAQQAVQFLLTAHDWISEILLDVFSIGQAGNLARNLIALLSIPVLVGLIPTLLYWMIRRSWFPYFMEIVWVVWLIQAGALIVMYKAVIAG